MYEATQGDNSNIYSNSRYFIYRDSKGWDCRIPFFFQSFFYVRKFSVNFLCQNTIGCFFI